MNNFLKTTKEYWFLIALIASLIVTWTNFTNAITDHDKRIDNLEKDNKQFLTTLQQIQVDVAIVRTKIENK